MIRHAPIVPPPRVTGRGDPACRLPDPIPAGPAADHVVASPARRCTATAAALYPGRPIPTDPRLWEQDFGLWEGAETPPDLGPLPRAALAVHRPPQGESFADLIARARPALGALTGTTAVVAHAGTIRAGLALALTTPEDALAFHIAPLSLTRIWTDGTDWAILSVNEPL
nr:histidine phosphatase family protein [Falsirhodobacter halotolerans]